MISFPYTFATPEKFAVPLGPLTKGSLLVWEARVRKWNRKLVVRYALTARRQRKLASRVYGYRYFPRQTS